MMAILMAGGCGEASGPQDGAAEGGPGSRLIVLPSNYKDTSLAAISGRLGTNASGCFVLERNGSESGSMEDLVLVAAHGSRVMDDGNGVFIPGLGSIELGEIAAGAAGGYLTDPGTLALFLDETNLQSEAESCGVTADKNGRGLVLVRAG